jgi:hypothetical protein
MNTSPQGFNVIPDLELFENKYVIKNGKPEI